MEREHFQKVVHGGGVWQAQRLMGRMPLDFSASTNPYPPQISPELDEALLAHYPDDSYADLKEAIGRVVGRPPQEIAVGNGSIELIRVICAAFINAGDTVAIPEPTFGEYALSAKLFGGRVVKSGEPGASLAFLCNPNNPDGRLVARDAVIRLLARYRGEGTLLCLDEAFIELADPCQSLVDVTDPCLLVLRSLTKSFAVPGIRFGYCLGPAELVARIETYRPPWSVNAYAVAFAKAAFDAYDSLGASRDAIKREREYLMTGISRLGIGITPSSANYLLLDLSQPAGAMVAALASRGILVRDCTSFGLPTAIRVAVRTREENDALLEALGECMP